MKREKAIILVHPGSLICNAVGGRYRDALEDFIHHDGPKIVIDGFLSDALTGFETDIWAALDVAATRGDLSFRLWGCDAGEHPYRSWKGRGLDGGQLDRFECQVDAARALAAVLEGYDIDLTGAWATKHGTSGCINSVIDGLREGGWIGRAEILQSALFEDDPEFGCTI